MIENAIQFSKPSGTVRISATAGRDSVECRVEDSGPGFPADEIDHVFDPFFTRRSGGTGLGLWIAHRNVEEHGGRIAVANRAEGGAVVTVRLPVAKSRG